MTAIEVVNMAREAGKRIYTTVGATDYLTIVAYCDARGITVSQWLGECIAEPLREIVSTNAIEKLKNVKEQYGRENSND